MEERKRRTGTVRTSTQAAGAESPRIDRSSRVVRDWKGDPIGTSNWNGREGLIGYESPERQSHRRRFARRTASVDTGAHQ